MKDFCKKCGGECCYIYKKYNKQKVHKYLHNYNLSKYSIKPLDQEDKTRCEFLGENGCIIPVEERPKICLRYKCKKLIDYLSIKNDTDSYKR